ncbi:MAG: hypothetical protein ACC742_06530 [Thermoanaerobaculales bacterium]
MPEYRPLASDPVRKGLESAVEGALADGAPSPSWIAVDDPSREWLRLVSVSTPAERARGVLATTRDESLVDALRLGIGGALRLPPSTPAAEAALTAAESAPEPRVSWRPELVESIGAAAGEMLVVSFADTPFWRRQLGDRELVADLARLADALDAPPAIVPWPALVVAGFLRERITDAWDRLGTEDDRLRRNLAVHEVLVGGMDVLASVYAALLGAREGAPVQIRAQPVHELPSGRLVGSWTIGTVKNPSSGWLGVPCSDGPPGCWELHGEGGISMAEEVLTPAEVQRAGNAVALRIPGWVARDMRVGSPAGLLVTALAGLAARSNRPLWIPNVHAEGLHFALRLPGTLWVDGPAAPR